MTHSRLFCDGVVLTMPKISFMFTILRLKFIPTDVVFLVALISCCWVNSCADAQDKDAVLSVPQKWRIENTAYPPPWAKSLPWKGTIELRFPPGFFQPNNAYHWSYPILYQLQGKCITDDEQLKRALLDYDAGLYGGKYSRDKMTVTFQKSNQRQRSRPRSVVLQGFDPFTTNKPITTYLQVHRRYDELTDQTIVLILRSARPINKQDPVWQTLLRFRKDAGF